MTFNFNKLRNLIRGFIIVIAFPGCFQHYYKATVPAYDSHLQKTSVIDTLRKQGKYFILRNGGRVYHMKDMSLNPDNTTMKTTLDELPDEHAMYLNKDRGGVMKYKINNPNDLKILSEVHVYITPDSNITTGNYVLQPGNIQKILVIRKNKARTIASHVLPFVIVGAAIGISIAIALSSLSFGFP
jgi:hypothetical protein